MRPFEAVRRVYLVFGADTMNEDAADALLKDLEEPPSYAVIVLVADDLGPLPETIRSRCQLVPFRRLSERAVRDAVDARAPDLPDEEVTPRSRVSPAGGSTGSSACSTRRRAARREALLEQRARRLPRPGRSTPRRERRRSSPASTSAAPRRARRRRRRSPSSS